MIRRFVIVFALAFGWMVAVASPSEAGCQMVRQTAMRMGHVRVYFVEVCAGESSGGTSDGAGADRMSASPGTPSGTVEAPIVTSPAPVVSAVPGNSFQVACGNAPADFPVRTYDACIPPPAPPPGDPAEPVEPVAAAAPAPPQVTPGMVAAALRLVPLPPSRLIVQPPNGRTLVNFETNFYTERAPFRRSLTLLGQQVDLAITPVRFSWVFGDGASTTTSSPGSAYPDLEITHRYLRTGLVRPSVATTYVADFRVGGGSWEPVPGTVTVPGQPVDLRVIEATPILVGY